MLLGRQTYTIVCLTSQTKPLLFWKKAVTLAISEFMRHVPEQKKDDCVTNEECSWCSSSLTSSLSFCSPKVRPLLRVGPWTSYLSIQGLPQAPVLASNTRILNVLIVSPSLKDERHPKP